MSYVDMYNMLYIYIYNDIYIYYILNNNDSMSVSLGNFSDIKLLELNIEYLMHAGW